MNTNQPVACSISQLDESRAAIEFVYYSLEQDSFDIVVHRNGESAESEIDACAASMLINCSDEPDEFVGKIYYIE